MPDLDLDGPLPIPAPSDPRHVAAVQRLRAHATSAAWLPQGLDPEVDEIRARHLAQRDKLATALAEVSAAESSFAREDREHAEGLRRAQRGGDASQDKPTPLVEREEVRRDLDAVVWASIEVLAEVVTEAIALLREAEPRILADLRVKASEGDARIRAAEAQVQIAQQEHFVLLKTGSWLKATVDQGPLFGMQPSPVVGPVPPGGVSRDAVAGALERTWIEEEVPVA